MSFICTLRESCWSQWDSNDPWVSCWIVICSKLRICKFFKVWRRSLTSAGDAHMLSLDLSRKALFSFSVQDVLEFEENMGILIWRCLLLLWFLKDFVSSALNILQCNCNVKFDMQQYKFSFKKLLRSLINCIFITLTIFRNSFNLQNVRNISKVERKPVSTAVLLEENRKYDITIESLKNGQILGVKSFKTRKSNSTKNFWYLYS